MYLNMSMPKQVTYYFRATNSGENQTNIGINQNISQYFGK